MHKGIFLKSYWDALLFTGIDLNLGVLGFRTYRLLPFERICRPLQLLLSTKPFFKQPFPKP